MWGEKKEQREGKGYKNNEKRKIIGQAGEGRVCERGKRKGGGRRKEYKKNGGKW